MIAAGVMQVFEPVLHGAKDGKDSLHEKMTTRFRSYSLIVYVCTVYLYIPDYVDGPGVYAKRYRKTRHSVILQLVETARASIGMPGSWVV